MSHGERIAKNEEAIDNMEKYIKSVSHKMNLGLFFLLTIMGGVITLLIELTLRR